MLPFGSEEGATLQTRLKGGIGSRNNGPPRRGQKALAGNNCCGSENSSSLFR